MCLPGWQAGGAEMKSSFACRWILAVTGLVFVAGTAGATSSYELIDLGTLGGTFSTSRAINDSGWVVGYSLLSDGTQHAFLYDGMSMQDLGTLGGTWSEARGINDSGWVAGSSRLSGDTLRHAYLYDGTTMHDLGTLGGDTSYGEDINDSGWVTGVSWVDPNIDLAQHAFLYDSTTMYDLGTLGGRNSFGYGMNNLGWVVGRSDTPEGVYHAFLYDGTSMQDLGSLGGSSRAFDVNDSGWVIGDSYISYAGDGQHAFLYDGSSMHDLGTLGGTSSTARGINSAGCVVGSAGYEGFSRAFLYDGVTMQDLNDLLDSTATGWTVADAQGINDYGWVTGTAINSFGETHAVILKPVAAVPEPATLTLLLMAGLSGLGMRVLRRLSR